MTDTTPTAPEGLTVVYDGDCPFCAAYVRMTRLKSAAGPVELVNARTGHPVLAEIAAAGLDLDAGMVVRYRGVLHYGDRAMTVLALLTTPSGAFNRLMRLIFSSPRVARVLYPPMVAGRNLVLRFLGRARINTA